MINRWFFIFKAKKIKKIEKVNYLIIIIGIITRRIRLFKIYLKKRSKIILKNVTLKNI